MRSVFSAGRRAAVLAAVVGVLAAMGALAPGAGAVLVHVGPGQVAGVTPLAHVNPASIPGSFARHRPARGLSGNGNLDYQGGAVLHASAPYLIFWDPQGRITASSKALYERYFADSAADSGKATNVFSVNRQYTDRSGFADYQQSFSAAQAITDTQPYPTRGNCTESSFPETACLFDAQLQSEVSRLIDADGLPTGIAGNAPVYFVVTPPDVNSCVTGVMCADNQFCAYHSSYLHGGTTVLYADIPTVLAANDPKSCQSDNNAAVQSPNGDPVTDVAIKYMSHEFNETITDPVNGGGWFDTATGQEDGDNCNFWGPTVDPANGSNPNAFTPTLGGIASSGTLFNQLINGNPYYTQSEWSNGDVTCPMKPTAATLSAAFSAPSSAPPGTAVSFDPSASTSSGGYTSTTWSFGDGSPQVFSRTAPTTIAHTYSAFGTYTVTLTLVDKYGNLSTVTHAVAVHGPLIVAFAASGASVAAGSPVSFDASASGEPGGSISSYSWDFGDGATATGVATSHSFATAGTDTVTLTVTDASGTAASASLPITVVSSAGPGPGPGPLGVPSAAISVKTGHPIAGERVSFDGSGSNVSGSSITGYSWSFGDGARATGATPTHTFAKTATYTVSLTVTAGTGATALTTQQITVKAPSIGKVRVKKGTTIELIKVLLTGPGKLHVGKTTYRVRRARTVTIHDRLSRSQRASLRRHRRLTIRVKLAFVPTSGKTSHKTVTIKLRS